MSYKPSKPSTPSFQVTRTKASLNSYADLGSVTNLQPLEKVEARICEVLPLSIPVDDLRTNSYVAGFLHLPQTYTSTNRERVTTAAILLSGAGGGVVGPSSIYLSIGDKLASLQKGIPVLRLDYRFPAQTQPCCQDVISAMKYLKTNHQISKFVLIGWSFGSAPVFTVAAGDLGVVACVAIAGQTADTSGIEQLHPRPVLLLHGTGDRRLSPGCSEILYENYGTKGSRQIQFFDNDDHALTKNSLLVETIICHFVAKAAGVRIPDGEHESIIKEQLMDDTTKVDLMTKGGDLQGGESIN